MSGKLSLDENVSRETIDRLQAFAALVAKWTRAVNLIAASTVDDIWNRHIVDSAQVFAAAPPDSRIWADLGSGGGFPGLVVAILAQDQMPGLKVHLVESDQRKCAFLRQAATQLDLQVQIHADRVENVMPLQANVVSARALARLDKLLALSAPHLASDGTLLLLKGEGYQDEVTEAQRAWRFSLEAHPSVTHAGSMLLQIRDLSHV